MGRAEREGLLRDYAAARLSWAELRERGFEDYVAVLGGLGELGLRPPIAGMTGPTSLPGSAGARSSGRPSEIRPSHDLGSVHAHRAVLGERAFLISTGDFLRELEGAGLIQSADHILDRAAEQGRNVERQRRLADPAGGGR